MPATLRKEFALGPAGRDFADVEAAATGVAMLDVEDAAE
jgi:hypothetical protein